MIEITTQQRLISFTVAQPSPITYTIPARGVNFYTISGIKNTYTHTLSQIDIDNKYIIISPLTEVDKSKIIVLIENASFIAEYGVDYTIDELGKISWDGFGLMDKLTVNDKIKVYY
jgi:hypothetical protein